MKFKGKDKQERFLSPLLSIGAVALMSGLTPVVVWMLVKKGVLIPQWNLGGKMLFRRVEIERWIER